MADLGEGSDASDPFGVLGQDGTQDIENILAEMSKAGSTLESLCRGEDQDCESGPGSRPSSRNSLAASEGLANPGDLCLECQCVLMVRDMAYECTSCHALYEPADIQDVCPTNISSKNMPPRARLRIVGRDSSWFQSDLDRTNPGESAETQKKSTLDELRRLNVEYQSRGGNAFPENILAAVSECYHVVRQASVKRSQMKREILAALTHYNCIGFGFTRTKQEVSQLLQLQKQGFARGDSFLREINENGDLGIDLNASRLEPDITSAFHQLEFENEDCTQHRAAAEKIVEIAESNHIGNRSNLRTKVIATTYEVLRRGDRAVPFKDVAAKCEIREHTIRRFLMELREYHSYFLPVYLEFGLDGSA